MKEHPPNNENINDTPALQDINALPALELNPGRYMPHMEEFNISEEQKMEFLETLFNIMKTFVDLGFGLDSVQLLSPESWDGKDGKAYPDSVNMLENKDTKNNFSRAAKDAVNKEDSDAPKHKK